MIVLLLLAFVFFVGLDTFRLKQGSGCIQRCLNLEFGSCNNWSCVMEF